MIELAALSKRFGTHVAVRPLNARIGGGITALLGPNGAGKTTLFNLIAGLDLPDEGTVRIDGFDPYHQHRKTAPLLGVLPAQDGLLNHMSAASQLSLYAQLFGLGAREASERSRLCLERVNLSDVGRKPVAQFSTGMRKRLAIARAMLHNPPLLLLDEPTNGLDPAQVLELRSLLLRNREEGRIVLFNTHNLSEVARVADQIMVMSRGELLFYGSRTEFLSHAHEGMSEMEQMELAYRAIVEMPNLAQAG